MSYAPTVTDYASIRRTFTDAKASAFTPTKFPTSSKQRKVRSAAIRGGADTDGNFGIIVHCHLSWDWVWQRPQQFVSRLSRQHRILFVETLAPDPQLSTATARFERAKEFPNITLLRLQFPAWRWPDGEYIDLERRRLVQEFVIGPGAGQFENPVQWFYDPMAAPAFLGHMGEILTVYDCMDELSKFRGAPPQIVERETELLKRADVVFTGGRKLFEAKSRWNGNCHFYACGVEGEHFGRARAAETVVPPDIASLPKPVLGFFGVVDERMDYELVAKLADANRRWSIVIIGPTIKVEPGALPRRSNLHWLGARAYADLPSCCKGFDLCLMPFALNESTEFINPTKALEYMATGRQIVSTAVPDVVRNFAGVVKIGRSHGEYLELCEEALEQPDYAAIAKGLQLTAENSWDAIVAELENHLQEALAHKRAHAA